LKTSNGWFDPFGDGKGEGFAFTENFIQSSQTSHKSSVSRRFITFVTLKLLTKQSLNESGVPWRRDPPAEKHPDISLKLGDGGLLIRVASDQIILSRGQI
jgi:hypothetical protein